MLARYENITFNVSEIEIKIPVVHNCLVHPSRTPSFEQLQMLHESKGDGTDFPGFWHLGSWNRNQYLVNFL